jgi:hypothetical protein
MIRILYFYLSIKQNQIVWNEKKQLSKRYKKELYT